MQGRTTEVTSTENTGLLTPLSRSPIQTLNTLGTRTCVPCSGACPLALWGYFLNLVSLAALVVGPASGIASHSGMLGADRGARGKRLAGAPGCVRWGIADQRREGGIAATLIRQRRPAERQAVFLPCRSSGLVANWYHSGRMNTRTSCFFVKKGSGDPGEAMSSSADNSESTDDGEG